MSQKTRENVEIYYCHFNILSCFLTPILSFTRWLFSVYVLSSTFSNYRLAMVSCTVKILPFIILPRFTTDPGLSNHVLQRLYHLVNIKFVNIVFSFNIYLGRIVFRLSIQKLSAFFHVISPEKFKEEKLDDQKKTQNSWNAMRKAVKPN